jgi:hypothetical protein
MHNATTSQTRGLREAVQEATAQPEARPRNSNERQWSRRKMQKPTMGGLGTGGWQLQSHRLTGDNTTTSLGRREQDRTRSKGGREGQLADVRRRCHKKQCSNQLGQTRGEREVELPAQSKTVAHPEAAVLTRGGEVEAA